jgi:hypothetical protein
MSHLIHAVFVYPLANLIFVSSCSFGSPRVGNASFAQLYNRMVPDSFRTVIDGDVVTSVPPTGYRHIGTEALVDNLGAGSIIVDPSFIERRLRTNTKSSVSVHSLLVYRKGLQGVKDAAEYMKMQASDLPSSSKKLDAVRLALSATNRTNKRPTQAFPQSPSIALNLAVSVGSSGQAQGRGLVNSTGRGQASSPADESKPPRVYEADAVELGTILLESPPAHPARSPTLAAHYSGKESIVSKLTANTQNGTARDKDYEDAYHYAKDVEQTEFLVSNISQGADSTGVQPIDALIRMMTKRELAFKETRTITTADFITADEDDAGGLAPLPT